MIEYLKEYRKQKKREQKLECLQQANRGEPKERILEEDAEILGKPRNYERRGRAENPGVGISYVEDESGKLIKRLGQEHSRFDGKLLTRRRTPVDDS
jgi:hypothetical protein